MIIHHAFSLSPLSEDVLDSKLQSLCFQGGSIFSRDGTLSIKGIGSFIVSFYQSINNQHRSFLFQPMGQESIGGDLFGFVIKEWDAGNFYQQGYVVDYLFDDRGNVIHGIYGYGENGRTEVTDKESLSFWYAHLDIVPEKVTVIKETMPLVGIEFVSGNWIYFISEGEGNFTVVFNMDLAPIAFIPAFLQSELQLVEKIRS